MTTSITMWQARFAALTSFLERNSVVIGSGQLFAVVSPSVSEEVFETLLETGTFRLERIVSTGQPTPPGKWYDQDRPEWVVLLSGAAILRFDDETPPRELRPGDWVNIPAHCRHRVEWTDLETATVWLALHYCEAAPGLEKTV